MLQESGFAADLTVAESVRLVGRLSGRTDDADRLLKVVVLSHKADTRVSQLSGGEKRRLDFATAVWGRPELVVLDEPTTGLDEENEREVVAALGRLAEGRTTLLITHDLKLVSGADLILYLDDKRVAESGTHEELMRAGGRYADLFRLQCQGTEAARPTAGEPAALVR